MFCTASTSTCAAGAPCTETDGLTINAAPGCRCGTASCSQSQNNLFCTASENTCAVGPPCSEATGVHPNSAPCKCGSVSCTISGGMYCDATATGSNSEGTWTGVCSKPSNGLVRALAEIDVLKSSLETKVTTLETDNTAEKAKVTTLETDLAAEKAKVVTLEADIVVINTKLTSVDTLYNNINKVCKTSETSDADSKGRRTDEGIGCGGSTESNDESNELNAAHTTTIGLTSILVLAIAMIGVNFI